MNPISTLSIQPLYMLAELPETVMNAVLVLGLLLIIASLMMSIRKRKTRHTTDQVTAQEHLERLKNKHAVKNDLESLMVEIEELGKRLSHQIDAKTIALERLLDEAEIRIAQLNQLNSSPTPPPATPSPTPSAIKHTPPQPPETPAQSTKPQPPAKPQSTPEADHHTHIYQLADTGQTAAQIAQTLGEHIGKIELILALRRSV
ncbi:preprotein translocase subunit SecG [Poriferisphaera corsica]|uniref:Preprotein translocase subunit SecG n=1 Tax=Poriferisphaera corsica TaxID=2528020 RepID=A0A517YQP4_9BACT|nr:hypothetical protein [Poriferisphaera corsica]QDU32549.1 preprotein translocase subunit SecG [Poriferisphaera corsica]